MGGPDLLLRVEVGLHGGAGISSAVDGGSTAGFDNAKLGPMRLPGFVDDIVGGGSLPDCGTACRRGLSGTCITPTGAFTPGMVDALASAGLAVSSEEPNLAATLDGPLAVDAISGGNADAAESCGPVVGKEAGALKALSSSSTTAELGIVDAT